MFIRLYLIKPMYKYQDPWGEYTLSEKQILDEYWNYWSGCMLKAHKSPEITEENCIEDFCIIHWAWKI